MKGTKSNTVKTHIQFTNLTHKKRKVDGLKNREEEEITETLPSYLHAPDEESARLASAVIHRIEFPEGKQQASKFTRKRSLNQRPERVLSLQDKQDAAQTVFAMVAQGIHKQPEGIAQIFRAVRDLLRMNGGNHDVSRENNLDEVQQFHPHKLIIPHDHEEKRQAERLRLADQLRTLRSAIFQSAKHDQSRKASFNLKEKLKIVRNIAAGKNPLSILTRQPLEEGARRVQYQTLREYLQIGESVSLSASLKNSMTALA
jgi:hypothetical protein